MNRRQILKQAFHQYGIAYPKLESYINCCDLTRPVVQVEIAAGGVLDVWVLDHGTPGKFTAPQGEDPATLAITIVDRHLERYVVLRPLAVIVCTAAAFAEGLVYKVGGEGGGTQYIMPPDWLKAVERIL